MSNAREEFPEVQPTEDSQPASDHESESERSLILRGDVINTLSEERLASVIRGLGLILGGEIRAQIVESGRIRNAGEPFTAEDADALGWTLGEWKRYQTERYGTRRRRQGGEQ